MKLGIKIAAGVILAMGFSASSWVTWMVTSRAPPVVYNEALALSPTAPQGGTLDVEFKVTRSRLCPVTSSRWLVDSTGERHSIPSFTTGADGPLGDETYQRTITIPQSAALGPAEYRVELVFICSVIDQLGFPINVVSPPARFVITPADG